MNDDWLYSAERMKLRADCIHTLLKEYGGGLTIHSTPMHSCESIYACAHDWVSQGHPTVDGVLNYYEDYYEADSYS